MNCSLHIHNEEGRDVGCVLDAVIIKPSVDLAFDAFEMLQQIGFLCWECAELGLDVGFLYADVLEHLVVGSKNVEGMPEMLLSEDLGGSAAMEEKLDALMGQFVGEGSPGSSCT